MQPIEARRITTWRSGYGLQELHPRLNSGRRLQLDSAHSGHMGYAIVGVLGLGTVGAHSLRSRNRGDDSRQRGFVKRPERLARDVAGLCLREQVGHG